MSVEAAIYIKRYDLEKKRKTSTAQAHDAFGHLVLLDYNTIGYVLRINHWEIMCKNIMYFPHRGCIRTPRTLYDYATAPHRGLGQLLSSAVELCPAFGYILSAWNVGNDFVSFVRTKILQLSLHFPGTSADLPLTAGDPACPIVDGWPVTFAYARESLMWLLSLIW